MAASRGLRCVHLAYFSEPGLPTRSRQYPLEYFEHAIRWMRAQPWLRDGFLAVWGPSRGGELALLLGATFPDINAVSAWCRRRHVLADRLRAGRYAATRVRGLAWQPLPYLQENNGSVEPLPAAAARTTTAYTPVYLSGTFAMNGRRTRHDPGPRRFAARSCCVCTGRSNVAVLGSRRHRDAPSGIECFKFSIPASEYEGAGHLIVALGTENDTHHRFKADLV